MDIEKIRTLIALMEESELVNLEISSDDEHISLTRHYDAPAPTMMAAPTAGAAPVAAAAKAAAKAGSVETSPIVRVNNSAASPNDPPFVKVDQKVQAGQKLGIIEARKIKNPLEATQSGVIHEILVSDSGVVQFGEPVIRYK